MRVGLFQTVFRALYSKNSPRPNRQDSFQLTDSTIFKMPKHDSELYKQGHSHFRSM